MVVTPAGLWASGSRQQPLLSRSCRCPEYVAAEELCDTQCLARAPQLSLVWGPGRELVLSVKDQAGDSTQRVSPAQERLPPVGMEVGGVGRQGPV